LLVVRATLEPIKREVVEGLERPVIQMVRQKAVMVFRHQSLVLLLPMLVEVVGLAVIHLVVAVLAAVVAVLNFLQRLLLLMALQTQVVEVEEEQLGAVVSKEKTAAQELSLLVTLDHNEAQVVRSHPLAATQFTHLLLQGHIQHEPLCKSL
jgi:hypothetical protein